jgi:hypothetical protein
MIFGGRHGREDELNEEIFTGDSCMLLATYPDNKKDK